MKKYFKNLVITCIVFIYLIIIAGAVVRMTGSGMGCPDWPKCFGYYIPPTEVSQIEWQPQREYTAGTIVIVNDALRIAPSNFTSGTTYDKTNWKQYTKHDYAKFNVWHTWIEYINRLVTVLAGFPMLVLLFISYQFWSTKKTIPIATTLMIIAMLFQAWLGKVVVDSNLAPLKITIHMVVAFIILAMLLYILFLVKPVLFEKQSYSKTFIATLLFASVCTLIQVGLGTQVRQSVDENIKTVGMLAKSEWLSPPTLSFYIHRSFSILVVVLNGWLWYTAKKTKLTALPKLNWVLLCIGLEAFTGILMYYFDFPFLSQPLHLVLSSLLFGIQFYILLETQYLVSHQ